MQILSTAAKVIGTIIMILGLVALVGGIIFVIQASSIPSDVENYVSLEAADAATAASSVRMWLGIENIVLGAILTMAGLIIRRITSQISPLLDMLSGFTSLQK
jgi:hypothetical protein